MIAAHESAGSSAAAVLLDNLLACSTQAEAGREITIFLETIGNVRGTQERLAAAAGASVVLSDVLLTGLRNLPREAAR